jgi:carbamoyl-phosphate synthase large subunit
MDRMIMAVPAPRPLPAHRVTDGMAEDGHFDRRRPHRMLISSAGRRVGLLRCFRSAAIALDLDLEILACDLKPEWSSACIDADRAFAAPPCQSESFILAMLELCEREQVKLIVPTIDTELIALSRARAQFAAIGTQVAIGAPGTVEMARDKLATARFLAAAGIASPRTIAAQDLLQDGGADWAWPLIAKPRHGSSSRGIMIVDSIDALGTLDPSEPYIVQEYLSGREVTVSVYFDRAGRLRCAIPHQRLRVRAGEVEKGVTIREPALTGIAERIGQALDGPLGAMCFQAIIAGDGAPSVFEINARFGGGYPLADHAGATFARWLLEMAFDRPDTACDVWQADVVMLRYDAAIFV